MPRRLKLDVVKKDMMRSSRSSVSKPFSHGLKSEQNNMITFKKHVTCVVMGTTLSWETTKFLIMGLGARAQISLL